MTDALLPCPFCGESPELDDSNSDEFMHEISCFHCDITMMASAVDGDLVDAWNRRAESAEIDRLRAENERLRGALTDALDALTQDEITFKADHWALTKRIAALIAKTALSPATGEAPKGRRHKVEGCDTCAREGSNAFHPPHDPSPRCQSGQHPHCSCDTCF